MTSVFDFTVTDLDGKPHPLAQYAGRVLLIVNVASKCGFTVQYAALEALHREFGAQGLSVLGFPCNQFGRQEPGGAGEIRRFCALTYDVTFPVLGKIAVNGPEADPLYAHLRQARPGLFGTEAIKWNFTKFLVGRDGQVLRRFAPRKRPLALERPIRAALG